MNFDLQDGKPKVECLIARGADVERFQSFLADCHEMTARKDAAYLERNQCVALIARMAVSMGLSVAVTRTAIEGWSEDWHGCVFIQLPTGQVSWHFHDSQAELFEDLPKGVVQWDGHSTPEKYERVAAAFRPSCEVAQFRNLT